MLWSIISPSGVHFYPRSPRGERPKRPPGGGGLGEFLSTLPARGATLFCSHGSNLLFISIHAPREGSDCTAAEACPRRDDISIHAPREGSDTTMRAKQIYLTDFYPRSPRGERLPQCLNFTQHTEFLSTLPARGATSSQKCGATFSAYFYPRSPRGERLEADARGGTRYTISIHAPREGSDMLLAACHALPAGFLSTLPARGATAPGRRQ